MDAPEQLYLLIQHAARRFRSLDAELDLSPARVSLLTALRYDGDQRITTLAAREGVSQPTMTKLVAAAEADGLVARVADPDDARAALVTLTRAGRALLRRSRARKLNWIGSVLRTLPPADVAVAARVAAALDRSVEPSG